ncbi:tetratricopeptide repeat protein [Hyphomicrobium sp. 2TAF46]|uniref:tetratricopeptide repeat protein n=1 Tax=Hyphomicrobium sp. 2TAF46 TaxID=3233019 RepID=UPI003F91D8CF
MPFLGMLLLFIAIGFMAHAYQTGRPQFWLAVLLFLPVVGSIAYVIFELLPDFAGSRRVRQVAEDLHTTVDPDRHWRQLGEQHRISGTVEAKRKFAEECERKGMWDQAITLYKDAAQGIYADDPDVLRGLARAQLGSGDARAAEETLHKLRDANPEYQNQDAHLTFARALEAQGRLEEAEVEYRALAGYFIGLEARTRYALLQQKLGDPAAARKLFEDVIRASKARGVVLSREDRDWAKVARSNTSGE